MFTTPDEYSDLLQMVVDMTYFRFNSRIYEQTYGMAMGSPLIPVLMKLFKKTFEEKAIAPGPTPPEVLVELYR